MDKGKIGLYLAGTGLALNVIDAFTAKDSTGGKVFGTSGVLTSVDGLLPHPQIMSTASGPIKMNFGGWLVVAGVALWAWHKWA